MNDPGCYCARAGLGYSCAASAGELCEAPPVRTVSRLRRPGGEGTAVNPYPGPAHYRVDVWVDPWGWAEPVGLMSRRSRPVRTGELRDANLGWGMWYQRARLPHEPVVQDGLWVPLYAPDPERASWRRRKWWGRGPIIFAPYGPAHRRGLALCDCFIAGAEGWPHAEECATRRGCR